MQTFLILETCIQMVENFIKKSWILSSRVCLSQYKFFLLNVGRRSTWNNCTVRVDIITPVVLIVWLSPV